MAKRLIIEIDEDKIANTFAAQGFQGFLFSVEARKFVLLRYVYQSAIKLVGPVVIGAMESVGLTLRMKAYRRAAMLA